VLLHRSTDKISNLNGAHLSIPQGERVKTGHGASQAC